MSCRKHQQKKAQLVHLPSSDLGTCQTLFLMYFRWGWKKALLFFFNVSYELIIRSISLLFTIKRNTGKHSVMQKISDCRICPACSQSFSFSFLPHAARFLSLRRCWLCPPGSVRSDVLTSQPCQVSLNVPSIWKCSQWLRLQVLPV